MQYEWYEYGLMIVIVSFLGFIVENVWLAVTKGFIDNRNMNLPFLLGYGLACVAIYWLFGTPSEMMFFRKIPVKIVRWCKILLYFLCAMLCVSAGEILLGTITEKICHIDYWNYADIPLHITKYTSIPTSMGFSTGITFFMDTCFPRLMETFQNMDADHIRMVSAVMLALLVKDYLYCYGKMVKTHDFYIKWRVGIPSKRLKYNS